MAELNVINLGQKNLITITIPKILFEWLVEIPSQTVFVHLSKCINSINYHWSHDASHTVRLQYWLKRELFFFFLDFGLSQLTSLQFIHCHVAGFYKPTIPQSPPSHLQDYSICNNARLEFSTNFVPSFDPIEWCLKNGLHSGGSNSQPFSHESSALTTRPRLLAYQFYFCPKAITISKWSSELWSTSLEIVKLN